MLGCSAKMACKIPAIITVDVKNNDNSSALPQKVEAEGQASMSSAAWGQHGM